MSKYRDITLDIGPLFREGWVAPHPMYSFERPAWILWQAVFEGLQDSGMSENQAFDWLASKRARWALDGVLGGSLRTMGLAYGRTQAGTMT